ncbi:lipoprotein [Moniliophthora roreri]|nr:lipoprotein [Moniliophthora roreri]
MLSLVFALANLFSPASHAAAPSPDLSFRVTSGGNDNFFYRDNITSAQVLLTSPNNSRDGPRRFIAALPAGNSGAITYFIPSNNSMDALSVNVINDTLTSTTDDFNNSGIQVDLTFSGNATLGVTIIGSIRAVRDYTEGGQSMNKIFNYTLESYNETSVRLHRRYINATQNNPDVYRGVDLYLSIPPESNARLSVTVNTTEDGAPNIDVLVPPSSSEAVRVRILTNETSLVGLAPQDLFLREDQATKPSVQTALHGLLDGSDPVAQQVSFLTYTDKFTAGGWRFLTYFGRDSLITLRLLMPIMTSESIEAALGAVIERTNTTGALCHEETIVTNRNLEIRRSTTTNHYFEDLPQGRGRAQQFLSRNATLQNGTYSNILNRISKYNFDRALPFYEAQTYSNLLAFRPGEPVGNWRDSNEGTGYGPIPFDVNAVLVPASLRATAALIDAGLLETLSIPAGQVAQVWEEKAPKLFEVIVDESEAEARLQNFVDAPNVELGRGILNGTSGGNVSFYALALREDGSPVEVMNSDVSFALMYGTNVSRTLLQNTIQALASYPRGLLTDVGMVVANPAYDSDTTNIEVLDRTAYHGTVIWSFQQGLMAGGLARQLSFCSGERRDAAVDTNATPTTIPAWCSDAEFLQNLQEAERRLWDSIKGAPQNLYSEVWSYDYDNETNQFSVADLASLSGGTESDAIQLWSYGFLGLLDPFRSDSS